MKNKRSRLTRLVDIKNNTYLSFVVAGKSEGNVFDQEELESLHRPRFGRNWWFWKPTFRTNGGRFKSWQNTDINSHWLCFSLSLTVYSWAKR